MPPQTRKTPDLDALARAVRVSILLIAGALAGCQGSGGRGQEEVDRAIEERRVDRLRLPQLWGVGVVDLVDRHGLIAPLYLDMIDLANLM